MKIDKNTRKGKFLWDLAFGYWPTTKQPKEHTSICKVFWSAMFGIIAWFIIIFVGGALAIFAFSCATIIGFLSGYRFSYKKLKDDSGDPPMVQFKLPVIRRHRIWPISMIACGWLIFSVMNQWNNIPLLVLFRVNDVAGPSHKLTAIAFFTSMSFMIVYVGACASTMFLLTRKIVKAIAKSLKERSVERRWKRKQKALKPKEAGLGTLIREYIRAKKEKVCPFVDIIEKLPKDSQIQTSR